MYTGELARTLNCLGVRLYLFDLQGPGGGLEKRSKQISSKSKKFSQKASPVSPIGPQSRTVLSKHAAQMYLPSGLKVTHSMTAPAESVFRHRPDSADQILQVLSPDADRTAFPSGLNATAEI